ncbi:hypothetical protein KKA69_00770 [Patescibacteria group bacterium]|nr:hypothetical protein [Patescibacteria group bacterium]
MRRIVFFLLIVLITFNLLYCLAGVIYYPMQSMDTIGIWLLKAKGFYLEGLYPKNMLFSERYAFSHQQYPLLLPLIFSFIYKTIGSINETAVLIVYPFLYLGIIFLAFKTLKTKTSSFNALLFTFVYSVFSPLLGQAGRVHAGNADIFLTFTYWLGIYLVVSSKNKDKILFPLALLIAVASQIKTEGIFMLSLLIFTDANFKKKVLPFFLAIFPFLIWQWLIRYLNIPNDFGFKLIPFYQIPGNILTSFFYIFKEFVNFKNWYIFWPLFILVLLFAPEMQRQTKNEILKPLLLSSFLYLFIYIFSSISTEIYVSSSIDRVLLQLSPLFFFVFFDKAHKLLK